MHLSACLMYAETRWMRTKTNMPRGAMLKIALRERCDALIELAPRRRERPEAHDLNP